MITDEKELSSAHNISNTTLLEETAKKQPHPYN